MGSVGGSSGRMGVDRRSNYRSCPYGMMICRGYISPTMTMATASTSSFLHHLLLLVSSSHQGNFSSHTISSGGSGHFFHGEFPLSFLLQCFSVLQ